VRLWLDVITRVTNVRRARRNLADLAYTAKSDIFNTDEASRPVGSSRSPLDPLNEVAHGSERVILESHGRAKAAIVGMRDLERIEAVAPGAEAESAFPLCAG
jgi:hypothetical protein